MVFLCLIFFHPDYTVGFGITPNPALSRSRTVTADRELHPALKILLYGIFALQKAKIHLYAFMIVLCEQKNKPFLLSCCTNFHTKFYQICIISRNLGMLFYTTKKYLLFATNYDRLNPIKGSSLCAKAHCQRSSSRY